MRRYTIDDWQQRLNNLNQPLVIIEKYKQDKKEVFKLQCYKCGETFIVDRRALHTACNLRERQIYSNNWCPYCNKKKTIKGVNDIATIREDLLKYFVNIEDAKNHGAGSHKRIKLRCPNCKQIKELGISDLCEYGFHCNYCNDNVSLGEKVIRNLILQLPVEKYNFEFVDSWTQNKRYDCFFEYKDNKYLIEIDGEQHIKNTNWSTKERQKQNDLFKTDLALNNGFNLIRIKAYKTDFDYIKQNVLESELANIFNLDKIDWDVICKQTVTSRNIEIAEFYNKHEDMMLKDIAKHFHISQPTVTKVLRKMSYLGMCDYSKEKAFKNGRIQNGKNMVRKNKERKEREN